MCRHWMWIAAAVCLPSAALAASDEWSRRWTVSGRPELRVEVDDGRVIVRGTSGNEIEARVLTSGWNIGSGGVQVQERQSGSQVEIKVRVPAMRGWNSMGNHSVRVELRVPRELVATIRTGDGSIEADDLKGQFRLRTGDGRIQAFGLDGSLEAETGDGSIRARGRFDGLNLRTHDGSVEAEVERGSRPDSPWEVTTGDGHITLSLPSDFAANLDAHTGDGRITSDLPLTSNRLGGSRDVEGKLNGGGKTLRLRTGDGPIRLARR